MKRPSFLIVLAILFCCVQVSLAAEPMKLVFKDDFSSGATHWKPTDPRAWKVEDTEQGSIYRLFAKSQYKPPVRSPINLSILNDQTVGDFVLTVKTRSTTRDYAHRDVCLVFGYQDPSHFYYVHFGKKTDNAANQIHRVNGGPRQKISEKTNAGTPWTDGWHTLRVERDVKTGTIRTFFDNMQEPAMTATDKHFAWGRIGIGSFDDTADFAEVRLEGVVVKCEPEKKQNLPESKGKSHGS